MTNVRTLPGCEDIQPIDVDQIFESAKGQLSEAMVIGFTESGEFYVSSSEAELGRILVLLELAKKKALEGF